MTKVARLTAAGSGLGAARELRAQGGEVAILSPSGQGEAMVNELGGLGVTRSNDSGDDLRRLVDGANHVTSQSPRMDSRLARTT